VESYLYSPIHIFAVMLCQRHVVANFSYTVILIASTYINLYKCVSELGFT
jgi:hypothetical protein